MGFLGFGKKRIDTVDLTNFPAVIPRKDLKFTGDAVDLRGETNTNSNVVDMSSQKVPTTPKEDNSGFDFLNNMASASSNNEAPKSNPLMQISEMSEVRTNMRKLSSQIEGSSNEVYRMNQRIELLERKLERFENGGSEWI